MESIAGVPGMVAATLRHLTSLRLMVCIEYENETLLTISDHDVFVIASRQWMVRWSINIPYHKESQTFIFLQDSHMPRRSRK